MAERLRTSVKQLRVPADPEPIAVTVSIGVHVAAAGVDEVEPLLAKADEAMYRAKREGRDRIELSNGSATDR